MEHQDVREAISADEITPEVETHLASCDPCTAWRARLEDVRRVAVAVLPPPPADLSDRVIETLRTEAPMGRTLTAIAVPSLWRRVRVRALTAAAVAVAVAAGSVVVSKTGADTPHEGLVAAVEKTTAKRSVVFFMNSDLRLTLGKPIKLPKQGPHDPFSSLPEGFRPKVEAKPLYPDAIRAIRTQTMASGQGVLPDRWRLSGMSIRTETEPRMPLLPLVSGGTESLIVGDRAWVRAAVTKGKWIAIEDAPATLSVDPGRFLRLAAKPNDAVEVGEEGENEDRTRHYRFTATDSGNMTVDIWVGAEDDLVRRMEVEIARATVPAGSVSGRLAVSFVTYGSQIAIDPPRPGDIISAKEIEDEFPFGLLMMVSFRVTFPKMNAWPTMRPTFRPQPFPTPTFIRPGLDHQPRWSPPEPEGTFSPAPEPPPPTYEPEPDPTPSPATSE